VTHRELERFKVGPYYFVQAERRLAPLTALLI
jgi:hypothetical protein